MFRSVIFQGVAAELELKFCRHDEKYSTFIAEPRIIGRHTERTSRTFDSQSAVEHEITLGGTVIEENLCGGAALS